MLFHPPVGQAFPGVFPAEGPHTRQQGRRPDQRDQVDKAAQQTQQTETPVPETGDLTPTNNWERYLTNAKGMLASGIWTMNDIDRVIEQERAAGKLTDYDAIMLYANLGV